MTRPESQSCRASDRGDDAGWAPPFILETLRAGRRRLARLAVRWLALFTLTFTAGAAESAWWRWDATTLTNSDPPISIQRAWAPSPIPRRPVILLLGSLPANSLPDWSTNLVREGFMLAAFTAAHPPDKDPSRRAQWLMFDERFAHSYALGGARTPADASRVIDHLAGLPEVDSDRIGWMGSSTTGIFGLAVAVREPRLKALVGFVATGAYERWLDTWKPNGLWRSGEAGLWPETRSLLSTADPIHSVSNLFPKAVILINGGADKVVDPASTRAFVDAALPFYTQDPERFRFVLYDGLGHNLPADVVRLYTEHWFRLYLHPVHPPPPPPKASASIEESARRTAVTAAPHEQAVGALAAQPKPQPIELICVDPEATGYGTFQSHNQKVVWNRRGFFMTHIRSRNDAYTAQAWRLSHSADAGRAFRTLHSETNATNPPLIESDAADNLYVVRPDFVDGHAYLYRFLSSEDYATPHITRIPGGAAGKYSMVLDEPRRQLAFFSHNNSFHRIGLDGSVLSSITLFRRGESAILQYPLCHLDEFGVLHAAWTSQKHGVYLYWDIHYLQSRDGGLTWGRMDGNRVTVPVAADESGDSDRITLDDEFDSHTWLASLLAQGGKAHFLYLAQTNPPRQHYVRYDLKTARREVDRHPEFTAQQLSLRGLDGFFTRSTAGPSPPLFCVSRDATSPRLACLMSDDNGSTWKDHAVSEPLTNPYAIGGCRTVTSDGWIIGSFTDQIAPTTDPGGGSKVYFFRIRAFPQLERFP